MNHMEWQLFSVEWLNMKKKQLWKNIKMIVFDIDGVLTDGMVYINSHGLETKRFSLTEIDALNEIEKICVIGAITGENTPIVDYFKKKVNWFFFESGCKDKTRELKRIEQKYGISREAVCYIGDGKYDLEAIKYAGLGVCPANAIAEVKEAADVVLEGRGGESCLYELYQLLKGMQEKGQ